MKKAYLSALLCLVLFSACAINTSVETLNAKACAQLDYKEVMELIKTPEQAAHYLKTRLRYKNMDTWYSFKRVHERGTALCAEFAFAAMAMLLDNDYPPLLLYLYLEDGNAHACFIYQDKTGKWGTLGTSKENSRGAIFEDLTKACHFIEKGYSGPIVAYEIHDLTGYNFIDGDEEDIYNQWNVKGQKVMLNAKQK